MGRNGGELQEGTTGMREQFSRLVRARINEDNDEQGFTLIELLIVIVVLGILAAVTVFGLSGTASQSAVSACKSDARTVEVAMDAYHANDSGGAWASTFAQLLSPANTNGQPANAQPYLRSQPTNLPHYAILVGNVPANPSEVDVAVPGVAPTTTGNFDSNTFGNGSQNICELVK
jgi:general secretion pathway protein G